MYEFRYRVEQLIIGNLNWAMGADAAIAPATMCGNLVLEYVIKRRQCKFLQNKNILKLMQRGIAVEI